MADPLTIIHGDALSSLRELPNESVQCCVTSPPYWGLRDYGTGTWDGGDHSCDHRPHFKPRAERRKSESALQGGFSNIDAADLGTKAFRTVCGKCGAVRVDIQIGLEQSPNEYVCRLVEVFSALKRVLRNDGTVWLNLGDSYASQAGGYSSDGNLSARISAKTQAAVLSHKQRQLPEALKPKDLVGIPWMVAFALRADGWYLRADIIWSKPNAMPESVVDRPTKSHEYIFLLGKSERYFYNAEAIKEAAITEPHARNGAHPPLGGPMDRNGHSQYDAAEQKRIWGNGLRNKRSVWTVITQPFSDAHFATFPPELITPCILAGTKPGDVVIDPFAGSGTTGKVAIELGRKAILIEPKAEYIEMIKRRCQTTIGLPLAI